MGAAHAGMQGVWVDRPAHAPWEPSPATPDLVVEGLDELADAMGV